MKNTVKISAIFIMLTFIILSAPIGRAGGSSHTLQEDISQYFENKSTVCLKLKNSGEITGVITNYNDSGLTLDIGFGTTVIPMKDIKAIAPGKAVKNPTEHSQQENFVRNNKQKENVFKRIEAAERIKQENIKKQNMITDISFKDRSRIHVDALLNGSIDVELLVDTGANLVSIPPHTARRLGIQIRRKNAVPVLLADGSTGEAMPITLRSIKVGNAEAKNVKAIVLIADQGQPQPKGLLGMSFLNNFHLKLDTDKNILTLIKK